MVAKGLPTAALRDAWEHHLDDIKHASSRATFTNDMYFSSGWLTGLVQAEVIDMETFHTLKAERDSVEKVVKDRLSLNQDQP